MGKRDRLSGLTPESTHPVFAFTIHCFGAAAGMTPWWAVRAGLTYTHMVIQVGDHIWDQPIRGHGKLYLAREWLSEALQYPRLWANFDIESLDGDNDFDWVGMLRASDTMTKTKSQPLRTVLRHLHLWPRRAWNCTGPTILVLRNMGMEIKGETPDAIIREIVEAAGQPKLAHSEQDSPTRSE